MKKKILVTGASSFLGHHVMPLLQRFGYLFEILAPTSKELNLLDRGAVINYICSHKPDIILHMAALCGGIGANKAAPAEFSHDNLKMSINIFDGIRRVNREKPTVTHFYGLGTVCAYPKNCPVPFKEDDIWNGFPEETNAPYGNSKRMMLVLQQSFKQQFGLKGAHLIPVNLYGEWDHFNLESSHVMPALINKFITAKEDGNDFVEVWGDGTPTREFLYAGDCAIAIVKAVVNGFDYEDPINIGTGHDISIKDLANLIKKVVNFNGMVKFTGDVSVNGQPKRRLDVSRARDVLGFTAKTDLITGLEKTVAWYRRSKSKFVEKMDIDGVYSGLIKATPVDDGKPVANDLQNLVASIRNSIGEPDLLNCIASHIDSIKPNFYTITQENKEFLLGLISRAQQAHKSGVIDLHTQIPLSFIKPETLRKADAYKTAYKQVEELGKFNETRNHKRSVNPVDLLVRAGFDRGVAENRVKNGLVNQKNRAEVLKAIGINDNPIASKITSTDPTQQQELRKLAEQINAIKNDSENTKKFNGSLGITSITEDKPERDLSFYENAEIYKREKAKSAVSGEGPGSFRRSGDGDIRNVKYLSEYESDFMKAAEKFAKEHGIPVSDLVRYKRGKRLPDGNLLENIGISDTEVMMSTIKLPCSNKTKVENKKQTLIGSVRKFVSSIFKW